MIIWSVSHQIGMQVVLLSKTHLATGGHAWKRIRLAMRESSHRTIQYSAQWHEKWDSRIMRICLKLSLLLHVLRPSLSVNTDMSIETIGIIRSTCSCKTYSFHSIDKWHFHQHILYHAKRGVSSVSSNLHVNYSRVKGQMQSLTYSVNLLPMCLVIDTLW